MLSEVVEWEVRLRPRKEGSMSILIKGMVMPKSCTDCPLFESKYHYHGCHAVPKSFNDIDMWNFVGDRPTWCPLIELPPHGRLIDADALNELIDSGDDIDFSEVPETKYAIMQMVNEQDTILEASPYRYEMIGKTDKPHGIYIIESEVEDG